MMGILSFIFSPLGRLLAALGTVAIFILTLGRYRRRAEQAERERDGLRAQMEIAQEQASIQVETDRRKEKIDEMVQGGDAAGLSAYINRGVQPGDKG
jgi:hypothetical protein